MAYQKEVNYEYKKEDRDWVSDMGGSLCSASDSFRSSTRNSRKYAVMGNARTDRRLCDYCKHIVNICRYELIASFAGKERSQ